MSDTPESEGRGIVRKLLVAAAISAVGTLLGFLLSKKDRLRDAAPKLRETVSNLPIPENAGGTGELTSNLRGKLDEVLGKEPAADELDSAVPTGEDLSKFEERRQTRQERRNQRRRRSRS